MTLPNFLIIGAPRSGTTTLYDGLRQHPAVFMSPFKEPWYYALREIETPFRGPGDDHPTRRGVRTHEAYRSLFAGVREETAIGEASTLYLYSERALRAIAAELPDVRVIVSLRNPADRAYSNYLQHVQQGREPLAEFTAALAAEEERIKSNWSPFWYYQEMGYYAKQLVRYVDALGMARVKVVLYDEVNRNPLAVMAELYSFLGVDERFVPKLTARRNASGHPRSRLLHTALTKANPAKWIGKRILPEATHGRIKEWLTGIADRNLTKAPKLDSEVRRDLILRFREDLGRLEELLSRDLSNWYEDRQA